MRYVPYGKTGDDVSVVGFGGMRFDMDRPQAENAELVRYASSLGINYFDTAPGYCNDKSEDIMGLAFQDMPNPFFCSTKGMPTSFDTRQKAIDAVKKSRDRLGVECIDYYHVWCLRKMEHFELATKPGRQYEGLNQRHQDGLINITFFSSNQSASEILRILESGLFEGVLIGVNVMNFPFRWEGLKAAEELGAGVVAMNPLGGGTIPQHAEKLGFLAGPGETPVEAALRFNIGLPQITITLPGFTTREHVEMACRIADGAQPFSDEETQAVGQRVSEGMNAACTACGYCLQCPEEIPIDAYMMYYNNKVMFGASDEDMKKTLGFELSWGTMADAVGHAGDCIECGRCEQRCTQHLDIMERLREIGSWERQLADAGE